MHKVSIIATVQVGRRAWVNWIALAFVLAALSRCFFPAFNP